MSTRMYIFTTQYGKEWINALLCSVFYRVTAPDSYEIDIVCQPRYWGTLSSRVFIHMAAEWAFSLFTQNLPDGQLLTWYETEYWCIAPCFVCVNTVFRKLYQPHTHPRTLLPHDNPPTMGISILLRWSSPPPPRWGSTNRTTFRKLSTVLIGASLYLPETVRLSSPLVALTISLLCQIQPVKIRHIRRCLAAAIRSRPIHPNKIYSIGD